MKDQSRISSAAEQPIRNRQGEGSSPSSGSRVIEWKNLGRQDQGAAKHPWPYYAGLMPKCPQCGCMKRPHVTMTRYERHDPELASQCGFRTGIYQAHCNYCKVRWTANFKPKGETKNESPKD